MAEAKILLKEARKAVDEDNFDVAITKCEEVLRVDPKNYMALVLLGMALRGGEKAFAAFKKAISLKGNNPLAYQGLAKAYENEGSAESLKASLEVYYKISSFPGVNELSVFKKFYEIALKIEDANARDGIFNNLLDGETDAIKKDKLISLIVGILKTSKNIYGVKSLALYNKIIGVIEKPDSDILKKYFDCILNVEGHESALNKFWEIRNTSLVLKEWFCGVLVYCLVHDIKISIDLNEAEYLITNTREENVSSEIAQIAEVAINIMNGKITNAYIKVMSIMKPKMRVEVPIFHTMCCIYLGRFLEAENSIELYIKNPSKNIDLCVKKLLFIAKASQHKSEKCFEALKLCKNLEKKYLGDAEKKALFYALLYLQKFNEAENCLADLTNSCEHKSLYAKLLCKTDKTEEALKMLLDDEDNHFNQLQIGIIYFKQKEYSNCFNYLLHSAKKNSHNFKVFLYLGDFYVSQEKNLEKAKKCYLKSFELNPECTRAGKSLSDIYMTLKDWISNEKLLKSLTKTFMETNSYQLHWAWMQLGLHYIAIESWDNAVANLRTYIRLEPTDVDAWEALADAYYYRGSYTSAMKCYNKTVELDPLRKYCQMQIGTIQCLLGFLNDALDTYKTICDGSYIPALKGLAEVKIALANEKYSQNLYGSCRDNAQEAIDLVSPLIVNQTKLTCLWKLLSNAISIILKLPSKYNWLYFNNFSPSGIGKLQKYENEELFNLEISCICKTINFTKVPDPHLYHELASMYLDYYNFSKNVTHIEKAYAAIEKCISIEKRRWQHWNLLGVICVYKAINKQSLAQHAFIKALKLDPINSTLWSNLGVFYLIIGEQKLANQSFKKAQEGNPAFIQSWIGQALIAECVGHHEAMDLFRHASQLGFNRESSLGYSYCVSESLLSADDTDSSNLLYSIKNMYAVPAATDLMLRYNDFENKCACSWNVYGILLENMGHFDKAIEAFSKSYNFANEKHRESVLLNLARNYMHLEKFEYVIEILNLIPNVGSKLAYTLALSCYKKEEYEESYRIYSEILEHLETNNDDKVFIFLALANIAYKSKDFETARHLSLQIIELCKGDSQIDALLAHFALSILIKDVKIANFIMYGLNDRFRKTLLENPVDEFNAYYNSLQRFLVLQSYYYLTFFNAQFARKKLGKCIHFHPNIENSWRIMSKLAFGDTSLTSLSVKKYLCLKSNMDNIEYLKLACISELLLGDELSSKRYAQKVIRIRPDIIESWTLLLATLRKIQCTEGSFNRDYLKALTNFIVTQPTIKADLEKWLVSSMIKRI